MEEQKPNVLIILADDLGYGDISSYGQSNYKTPQIDNIGAHGVSLSNFYNMLTFIIHNVYNNLLQPYRERFTPDKTACYTFEWLG